jgi:hypothetical protein
MVFARKTLLVTLCLLGMAISVARIARPAYASDFTAFADDEDACRKVGTAAIGAASGPAAARLYDVAHYRCMVTHVRMRQMEAYRQATPPTDDPSRGNPHSFDYPDAFYSIPYATPGYGYDGFSP